MHFKNANHWPGKDRVPKINVKEERLGHFTIVKTVMWGPVSIRSSNFITQNSTSECASEWKVTEQGAYLCAILVACYINDQVIIMATHGKMLT
jgi:hypothetical protein